MATKKKVSKLVQAVVETNNHTVTEKGMPAYKSTLNACVDLFYTINASRGKDMYPSFLKAYLEDQDVAIRILLNSRDIRQGAGERQIFRDILKQLAVEDYFVAVKVAKKIPELGRFDDLLVLHGTPAWPEAVAIIQQALNDGNGLCAKWMPRKGNIAVALTKALGYSPKQYRKTLVNLTNVVETAMCSGDWSGIDYSKVPSLASARYQKAFGRHDPVGYGAYLSALQKGETTIHAGAVYPYDVVKSVRHGNSAVANEQWKALPDYVKEGVTFLPLVDVSGSMDCPVGGNHTITCMDVAISLGLYLSERNKSVFKDSFITFSAEPEMITVKGTLTQRIKQMEHSDWGYNTNFEAVFDLILKAAKKHNLSQEDLPTYLIVLSDMQFDQAARGGRQDAYQMAKQKFNAAGYEAPAFIFWNLRATDNVPVKHDQQGVAMVSGGSPSVMKTVLGGKQMTPYDVMIETVMVDRYNWR